MERYLRAPGFELATLKIRSQEAYQRLYNNKSHIQSNTYIITNIVTKHHRLNRHIGAIKEISRILCRIYVEMSPVGYVMVTLSCLRDQSERKGETCGPYGSWGQRPERLPINQINAIRKCSVPDIIATGVLNFKSSKNGYMRKFKIKVMRW